MWIQLYSYKLPAAAAITGHSPAGGCLLSLCCDYRVMQGPKFTIGLNETLLGIVAPFWFKVGMCLLKVSTKFRGAQHSKRVLLAFSPKIVKDISLTLCSPLKKPDI